MLAHSGANCAVGEWSPRQIPNPAYFVDERPADMAPIGGIAVEVWTTNGGIHFDNFILASGLDDAFGFAEETFRVKEAAEKAQELRELEESRRAAREEKLAEGGFVNTMEVHLADFLDLVASQSPIALVSAIVMLVLSVYFCIPSSPTNSDDTSGRASAPVAAAEEEKEKQDQTKDVGGASNVHPDGDAAEDRDEDDDGSALKSPAKRRTRKTD